MLRTESGVAVAVGLALLGVSSLSEAAGFRVNEQGAKAMAMANAFVAQADDPTALYYNPAGISFLKGMQANLGGLVITVPQTEFYGATQLSPTTPVGEKAKRDIFIAPTLYATYSLESVPLTFGLGVNSIYPLAKRWDTGSAFRNIIQDIAIKPINFQPTVAYRFDNLNLSIAAGIDVTHAIVSLQKMAYAAPVAAGELGTLSTDGTATDVGYNFGLLWKPRNDLSFGISYRSEITLHIDGDANYLATTATGQAAVGGAKTVNSKASTKLTLPDSLGIGIAWKPTDKLTLEFDAERTGWSSYDKLELSFQSPQLAAFNNKPAPKNWEDCWAYRLGAQYALTPKIDLRAGYAYDTSPIPNSTLGPELPDSDRHNFSFGAGIHNDFASLDMAYMFVYFNDRAVSNSIQTGTYKSEVHLFGASFTVKF